MSLLQDSSPSLSNLGSSISRNGSDLYGCKQAIRERSLQTDHIPGGLEACMAELRCQQTVQSSWFAHGTPAGFHRDEQTARAADERDCQEHVHRGHWCTARRVRCSGGSLYFFCQASVCCHHGLHLLRLHCVHKTLLLLMSASLKVCCLDVNLCNFVKG